MKKPKIYLDTSVISHLDQSNHPDWTVSTLKFWEYLKSGKFDVVISTVVDMEIEDCKEKTKRDKLRRFLGEIEYVTVNIDKEIEGVAKMFIDTDILKPNCMDDALHLAVAMIYNCDGIVSWNFSHIVNYNTITGVKVVSALSGYGKADIAYVLLNILCEVRMMKKIDKPVTSSNFTIEDIHAMRRYNYEITRTLSQEERLKYYNDSVFRKVVRERFASENVCCYHE